MLWKTSLKAEQLRREQLLTSALGQSGVGFLVLDFGNREVLAINRLACDYLGIPLEGKEETVLDGQASRDLFSKIISKFTNKTSEFDNWQPVDSATQEGQPQILEIEHGTRKLLANSTPVYDDGRKVVATTYLLFDITSYFKEALLMREIQAKSLRSQNTDNLALMAGAIAHDFNNILLAIMGYTDLSLASLPPDSPLRGNLLRVMTATRNAATLCHQMLCFSGQTEINTSPINLAQTVTREIKTLRGSLYEQISLSAEQSKDLPPIRGDWNALRNLYIGLIQNAGEAIGSKPGTISLSFSHQYLESASFREFWSYDQLPSADYLVSTIKDDGVGIAPHILPRIFEPFFSTKFFGRGLALSSALGIMKKHAGAIRVQSELGQGTVVELFFPILSQSQGSQTNISESAGIKRETNQDSSDGSSLSGTVLLVDDDSTILQLTTHMLQNIGMEVIATDNGLTALELLNEHLPTISCIILDLTMGAVSGLDTLCRIRSVCPSLPIVMSSGYSAKPTSKRLLELGATCFLEKPYSLERLTAILKEALNPRTFWNSPTSLGIEVINLKHKELEPTSLCPNQNGRSKVDCL